MCAQKLALLKKQEINPVDVELITSVAPMSGSFGEVFQGKFKGQRVAIKRLQEEGLADQQRVFKHNSLYTLCQLKKVFYT